MTAFQVPASKASIKQNQFEFKLPGDRKTYTIPKMQFLKPNLIDELDPEKPKTDVVKSILEHYHPGLWESFDELSQATAFFEAWAQSSGVDLGESSASTDS